MLSWTLDSTLVAGTKANVVSIGALFGSGGNCRCNSSLSTPLVTVTGRWIVLQWKVVRRFVVPIDFNESIVAIYQTRQNLRIIKKRPSACWLMPGPREKRRQLRRENGFDWVCD